MIFKYIKRVGLGVLIALAVYLAVVWFWANAAVTELLAEARSSAQEINIHPRHLEILIKVEDPTFYEHRGLDISNGQGLTTITSSLARDIFLYGDSLDGVAGGMQSFYRKVFSCCKKVDLGRDVMALALNKHTTKDDQLNLFLNSVYLGHIDGKKISGFKHAAMAYYVKAIEDLSDQEFTGIVAMIIGPNYYNPVKNPEAHAERVARITSIVSGRCEPGGLFDLTYDHC